MEVFTGESTILTGIDDVNNEVILKLNHMDFWSFYRTSKLVKNKVKKLLPEWLCTCNSVDIQNIIHHALVYEDIPLLHAIFNHIKHNSKLLSLVTIDVIFNYEHMLDSVLNILPVSYNWDTFNYVLLLYSDSETKIIMEALLKASNNIHKKNFLELCDGEFVEAF
jgi:hypothetical protein